VEDLGGVVGVEALRYLVCMTWLGTEQTTCIKSIRCIDIFRIRVMVASSCAVLKIGTIAPDCLLDCLGGGKN
jgi:hypothetical protein